MAKKMQVIGGPLQIGRRVEVEVAAYDPLDDA